MENILIKTIMPRPAPFVVILTLLLIFSLVFLTSFSYDDFFRIEFLLSLKTYLILVFLVGYLFEFKFNTITKKEGSTFDNVFVYTFPLFFTAILIALLFIIFSISESPSSAGHGGGGFIGLLLLFYVSIGGLIYGVIRVVIFVSRSNNQADLVTQLFNNLNSLLNNSYKYLLPILIISSISIFSLAYFDFKTGGIKYKFSKETNHLAMSQKAINQADLSYCDYVAHRFESYKKECFQLFFKNDSETQSLDTLTKKNTNQTKNKPKEFQFFTKYKQLEQKHCSKSKYYDYCTAALFLNLLPTLKHETEDSLHSVNWKFSYQTSLEMMIIEIDQRISTFNEIDKNDVKRYNKLLDRQKILANKMSTRNAVIKTVNNEHPRTREKYLSTEIHIDPNKLLKNDKDYSNIIDGIKEVFNVKANPKDNTPIVMDPNATIKTRITVPCKLDPNDPPSLYITLCFEEKIEKLADYCKKNQHANFPDSFRCPDNKLPRFQYKF